jgi:hypothetical protein
MYGWREFVLAGGLKSYGPNIADGYRQSGTTALGTKLPIRNVRYMAAFGG